MTRCRRAMTDPRLTLRAEDARSRSSPYVGWAYFSAGLRHSLQFGTNGVISNLAANEACALTGNHCLK
jgi:hypothetical protein